MAEYIWIGGTGHDLRSKTKVLQKVPKEITDLPQWNFDGSSTKQAPGHDSEVILVPRATFPDPFRDGHHLLVLCDTYTPQGQPLPSNTRAVAQKIFERTEALKPTFAFEQEYSLFYSSGTHFGFPHGGGYPAPQGPYYCSVGSDRNFGREIVEAHMRACLYAGLQLSGINAEVLVGQWEYQIGPVVGIHAADQLWVSRYILHRVAELNSAVVSFDPKPLTGDWNGAGCHINFCIQEFHETGGKGWERILRALKDLERKHQDHIEVYGEGNERRLTGKHETAPIHKFSWGVANRGASIRVPRQTEHNKRGYIEDRRPASNVDPYLASAKLVETICCV